MDTTGTFRTNDLVLAAYLKLNKTVLLEIVAEKPTHAVFVFADEPARETLYQQWLNDRDAVDSAQAFHRELKNLKRQAECAWNNRQERT